MGYEPKDAKSRSQPAGKQGGNGSAALRAKTGRKDLRKLQSHELGQESPFAKLLIAYMWQHRLPNRPPMTVAALAIKLGISKQTLSHWVYHNGVPLFPTALDVLAKLNIPVSRLINAYRDAGMQIPPLFDPEESERTTTDSASPPQYERKTTRVPSSRYQEGTMDRSEEQLWNTAVRQTQKALREAGATQSMIDSVTVHLRSAAAGEIPFAHNTAAEHRNDTEQIRSLPQRTQSEDAQDAERSEYPTDTKWYLAEIIEETTVEGEPNNVVHVNWVLIRAHSPDEAYEKAIEQGGYGSSYLNPKGQMVRSTFRGLRGLDVIHDDLEDGAEITYEKKVGMPEDEITAMITPKDQLEVFLPTDPTPEPGRPDYKNRKR
jgi:hypothetical protein